MDYPPILTDVITPIFTHYFPRYTQALFGQVSGYNKIRPNVPLNKMSLISKFDSSVCSIKNLLGYEHMKRAKDFIRFDYGSSEENIKMYG
jgi:hypothetical protein